MPYFAQASIDENGKIAGGEAGNQNGRELNTRTTYASDSKPWLFSVIAIAVAVQSMICTQLKYAVANPYIGYDQDQRNTLLIQARKVGWDLSKIRVACECDCSSLLAVCMICAVYLVLGEAAGKEVEAALYEGGNLPATSNFKAKAQKLDKYFRIGGVAYTPGYGLIRSGHAVGVVDALVTAGKLSTGASSTASLASSKYPCKGWTGEEVRRIQRTLEAKGYSVGSSGVDGDFGVDTYAAVCKFQSDRGLEIDGIVGPMTQTALYNTNAPVTPSITYHTGTYSTAVGDLNVRTGAGTGYRCKTKAELTVDGRKHSNDKGQLNSGTKVTVSKIQRDSGGNTWGLIPSGWICLEWAGKAYVK